MAKLRECPESFVLCGFQDVRWQWQAANPSRPVKSFVKAPSRVVKDSGCSSFQADAANHMRPTVSKVVKVRYMKPGAGPGFL